MSWQIIKIEGSKYQERKKMLQTTCPNLSLAQIFLNESRLQPPMLDHFLNNTRVDLPISSIHKAMCVDGFLKIENYKNIPISWIEADEFISLQVQVQSTFHIYSMIRYTDNDDELEVYLPPQHI